MKRLICMVLTACLFTVCFCGCDMATTQQMDEGNDFQQTQQSAETTLTVGNISDYLIISTDVDNVNVWENEYVEYGPDSRGYATIKVKTASKQNVEFRNVTITFRVVATGDTVGYGWDTIYPKNGDDVFQGTLNIPYNGVWEENYEIMGEYKTFVYSKPDLTIEVMSVSGTVINQ